MDPVKEHEKVLNDVRVIMEKGGINQAQVARESGISVTSISQLFSGSYPAKSENLIDKLSRWLAAQAEKSAGKKLPAAPQWVETPTSARIMAALGYAQMAGDISLVYGAAGLGKTATIKEYARRMPNVWVVTASAATTSTVTSCLEEVLLALGMRELPQGAARLHREAVKALTGSEGLLIIDEAQHLCLAALDAVRALHDAAGIGLALLGNEIVYARMTGGNRAAYLDRLFSRIGKRVKLTRATSVDVRAVAEAFGVSEGNSLRLLVEIGAKPGGLRAVVKTVRMAVLMAGNNPMGEKHIRAAWADLEGTNQ